jgi:hypothetical protein
MATTAIPDGAACYFCLGEEGDEEGNSLVRDCSCRGNSGFAHLSCLSKYAEQKCRAARDGDSPSFREPWYKCTNCKQPFQNQLLIDLASAFVSFAEATYGHDGNSKWEKMKVMDALRLKIESFNTSNKLLFTNDDKKDLINQLLDTVKQTKQDLNMNSWVHMPKSSEEYQYYTMLCGNYEAYVYKQLGGIARSEEDFNAMITHYKKARAIYNLVDMKDDAQRIDTLISLCTDSLNKQAANDGSEFVRNMYERDIHTHGMDSEVTIQAGLLYAKGLRNEFHCIEAERLVTKLATISRRVHGPDHKITIKATELLEKYKDRYVIVLPEDGDFLALRYENDGDICVVAGPISEPRNIADERMYRVEKNLIIPNIGCTVICYGLVSALHLNGELGEVRNVKRDVSGLRLGVYFEKKGVRSALVKPENLRIAFELPVSSEDK